MDTDSEADNNNHLVNSERQDQQGHVENEETEEELAYYRSLRSNRQLDMDKVDEPMIDDDHIVNEKNNVALDENERADDENHLRRERIHKLVKEVGLIFVLSH